MVSTRTRSYQPPAGGGPETGPPARAPVAGRTRHASLNAAAPPASPTPAPARRRRTSSLTAPSAEPAEARPHRKELLQRYRRQADALPTLPERLAGSLEEEKEEERLAESPEKEERPAKPESPVEEERLAKPEPPEGERPAKPEFPEEERPAKGESPEEEKQSVEQNSAEKVTRAVVPAPREADEAAPTGPTAEQPAPDQAAAAPEEDAMEVEDALTPAAEPAPAAAAAPAAQSRGLAAVQRILAGGRDTERGEPPLPPPPPSQTARPPSQAVRPPPPPRGQPKSGRFWKPVRSRASKVLVRDPVSYEVRMQKRQQLKVVKALENQLKDERKQKQQELRKRREYNEKKTAENALKSEVYQVIKNPQKIKRMKKKQLRLLQKRDTTVVGKSVLDE
ncbi:coiled-coil domain-containing protein 86-like isoform X2 [Pollicipes pollicipes]|nr:coiled-coil domain-containing protein 86-like isoform X2 [Pollicipes pollicipes]XP_037069540.1 coiled-coil domain-containing protein 86-like isoform X2 [Pollicipes pollicipes]